MRRSLGITVAAALALFAWGRATPPTPERARVDAAPVRASQAAGASAVPLHRAPGAPRSAGDGPRGLADARSASSGEGSRAIDGSSQGRARELRDRDAPALALRSATWEPRRLLVSVEGRDPGGPQPLVLWRVDPETGGAAVVGRAASTRTGRVRFAEVPLPGRGAHVVAAPLGVGPHQAGASEVARIGPRPPEPPRGRLVTGGDAGDRLEIHAGETGGAILVGDPRGEVLARWPADGVEATARSMPAPEHDAVLLLGHERTDGARSRWRAVFAEPARSSREGESR